MQDQLQHGMICICDWPLFLLAVLIQFALWSHHKQIAFASHLNLNVKLCVTLQHLQCDFEAWCSIIAASRAQHPDERSRERDAPVPQVPRTRRKSQPVRETRPLRTTAVMHGRGRCALARRCLAEMCCARGWM